MRASAVTHRTRTQRGRTVAARRRRRLGAPGSVPRAAAVTVALTMLVPRAPLAQTLTLPTVRMGGPLVAEVRFLDLIRSLRAELAADTVKLVAAARDTARVRLTRWDEKLDSVRFAVIDDDRFDRVVARCNRARRDHRACTRTDTLVALAGKDLSSDDPFVLELHQIFTEWLKAARQAERARQGKTSAQLPDSEIVVEQPEIGEGTVRRLMYGPRSDRTLSAERQLRVDSLTRLAVGLVILRKFDTRDGVLPVHSHAQAEVFWGQQGVSPLNVGAIAGSRGTAVAYTEIAAPIFHFARLSLGTTIAASDVKDSPAPAAGAPPDPNRTASRLDTAAAVQRLLTGGGLLNVGAAVVLLHSSGRQGQLSLTLLGVPRLGLLAPKVGATTVDSTSLVLDGGLELHGKVLDLLSGVGLVGQVRWAHARGARDFGRSLGLAANHLTYATTSLGFVFNRQYMLTGSRAFGGPRAVRRPDWTLGLTLVRMPTL